MSAAKKNDTAFIKELLDKDKLFSYSLLDFTCPNSYEFNDPYSSIIRAYQYIN